MSDTSTSLHAAIPSVDRMLRLVAVDALMATHGRPATLVAVRATLDEVRDALKEGGEAEAEAELVGRIAARLECAARPTLRPVFNLTGTVLHTNLGRAPLPDEAIAAMGEVARGATNLEFNVASGKRGERDDHVEDLLCRLTGAEAATVVNNNAGAVLLVLNSLALRKEVPVSRGELIEIGGAFRMPDIMARAGCKLVEVGTTNRTHPRDFEAAMGPRTALLMKVHTSNYVVEGFSDAVPEAEMAAIAHAGGVSMITDLGSGTLVDLTRYGLPYEPTASDAIAAGADLVTFSGDKLLGGPQAGIIVGSRELVGKVRRNPMKRAMRIDKITMAALAAVLRLYADPDRLTKNLPTLRLLARPEDEIEEQAHRLAPVLLGRLTGAATVGVEAVESQIGSGALPGKALPSRALVIRPIANKRGGGAALGRLVASFRALPVPVIGRIHAGALVLDLRCLDDEAAFTVQLSNLGPVMGQP